MIEKTKEVVKLASKEELCGNTNKHSTAVRAMDNCEGDHIFMDKGDKWHSTSRAPLTTNGNDEKRVYGHIITGEQHVIVLISLIAGDLIVVWHDQIYCYH